jgi:hypothetical protein
MTAPDGTVSPSGVRIAADFRDNLIIDRYDPVFADMRASKLKHLRSANSEDAITWNVFRSLRQIAPAAWLPSLWTSAFPAASAPTDLRAAVTLWESVAPPLGLLSDGDEGASEIDVVIQTPTWVWFIEAKYRSDISTGTTTRPDRDQILRNLDVGSYFAAPRTFHFGLLVGTATRSPRGVEAIKAYSTDLPGVRSRLAKHRPDGLSNLGNVGHLTWADLVGLLSSAAHATAREDERVFAQRAMNWLEPKVAALGAV